jgi:Ca-activated chloride channel homolog
MRVLSRSLLNGSEVIQACFSRNWLARIALPALAILISVSCPSLAATQQKRKLPRPRELDKGISWNRNLATGELRVVPTGSSPASNNGTSSVPSPIRVITRMVPVTCSVSTNGVAVRGLRRQDFRVFDNGIQQTITYFDASNMPASVALVIDASPSVLRDSDEMKQAADALVASLAPLDNAAVVDFAAHIYLQAPFTDVRDLVRRAVDRISVRALLSDTGGSDIYKAVYLTAETLFPGRLGRKSIVLLTDGQDSGLGLTLDPASASPRPGFPNRLTFDDVGRILASEDVQIFAVSTENRPKIMTPEWLAAHNDSSFLTPAARDLGIPTYTLYLAELVRRAGGQLYFLNETRTVADTFTQIARRIRAEYTLGYYPSPPLGNSGTGTLNLAGWHRLRVEVVGQKNASVVHRAAYYVPATQ